MNRAKRFSQLVERLKGLTEGQLLLVENAADVFQYPHTFTHHLSTFLNVKIFADFGDALRLHHAFSSRAVYEGQIRVFGSQNIYCEWLARCFRAEKEIPDTIFKSTRRSFR